MSDPYLDPIKAKITALEYRLNIANQNTHTFRRVEALEELAGISGNPLHPLDKRVDTLERKLAFVNTPKGVFQCYH